MSACRRYSSSTNYPTKTTTTLAACPWRFRRPSCPPPVRRSVARWERDFCESRGVPWKKITDPDAGLSGRCGRIALWDDSGAVQALLDARKRSWAEINGGLSGTPPPPDPDMYIDKVDEDGIGKVDPELDAEYEAARRAVEAALEENARLQAAALRDNFVPVGTGWDVDT